MLSLVFFMCLWHTGLRNWAGPLKTKVKKEDMSLSGSPWVLCLMPPPWSQSLGFQVNQLGLRVKDPFYSRPWSDCTVSAKMSSTQLHMGCAPWVLLPWWATCHSLPPAQGKRQLTSGSLEFLCTNSSGYQLASGAIFIYIPHTYTTHIHTHMCIYIHVHIYMTNLYLSSYISYI